ncbi:carbamoyltransferase [Glycomyces paridis]|uniref:Carbamoyltransferase n=1 Tax=Glycomyces paridis TaxID=2126555 RepID=A0A4S8P5E1_9ACTN|nr:carbamoyltransferase C-terminal domain-containing protein [Glycomyces paridis]THV24505.1 carbamoyltransferase [Glycomyces paridis]
MPYILGVNLSHDRSAAIVKDGVVLAAVEEERLDRIKHSEGFLVQGHFERLTKIIPIKAIAYCLDAAGIGVDEVDLIVGNRPLGDGTVRRILRDLPLKDKSKVHAFPQPSHHLAHAATAFYTSPFDSAAVLVVDQAGSRSAGGMVEKHTLFTGSGTELTRVAATEYPVDYGDMSLGLFYDFFTAKLGFTTRYGTPDFGVFECGGYPEAGKTMGLAPYGTPRPDWGEWLTFDGFDITVSQDGLEQIWKGIAADEGAEFESLTERRWDCAFAKDVARKVQDELEQAMLHLAAEAHRRTGETRLCLGGGVMLNSVANHRVRAEGPFEEVFIPAPAGDSGNAVGAALYGWHRILEGGQERRGEMTTAAYGVRYPRERVLDALDAYRDVLEWREAPIADVAELLAGHRIVAWVNGGSEMGPRALGHRSILADPRHPRVRDYLNETVKHREPFRPYAPSVLAEAVEDWFDFRGESPFMLLVPEVLPERRDALPAVTHVDGTARVQTVDAAADPEYHELISRFADLTGVPIVLNTSFNDNGEPIVETPEDALRTFARTEIDHLYIEGYLVSKPGRDLPADHPARTGE